MKKNELLVTEYRTLNHAYEYSQDNLQAAKEAAKVQANISGKVLVIVRVVEIITPDKEKSQPD
jgi:hypothetical protein